MAAHLKSQLKLTQSLQVTQRMQQSLKLLSLSKQDLLSAINEELAANPCLSQEAPGDGSHLDARSLLDSLGGYLRPSPGEIQGSEYSHGEEGEGGPPLLDRISTSGGLPPLSEHLRVQIQAQAAAEGIIDSEHPLWDEVHVAETLVDELDERGFFSKNHKDLALELSCNEEQILGAIARIQACDPPGVGARSYQECFLLQLQKMDHVPTLVRDLVEWHWALVEKQNLPKLARAMGCEVDEARQALKWIGRFCDPRPTRSFGNGVSVPAEPDVFVFKRDGVWTVSLNDAGLPRLKLSKKYEALINHLSTVPKDKAFLHGKMGDAQWFIKSLSERNKTILRVMEYIVEHQSLFLEKGLEALKPMTLKDIALELGLHESTISRATSQKYVNTPRGLFEIKTFFSNGFSTQGSAPDSSVHTVRNWVRAIIQGEAPTRPFSDQMVSQILLETYGVKIARRTVAKYREELGIPGSSQRLRAV